MSDDQKKTKLRADYAELFGKAPFNGWDEAELQKRIDAKLAGQEPGDQLTEPASEVAETGSDPYPSQAHLDKMRSGNFDQYKSR